MEGNIEKLFGEFIAECRFSGRKREETIRGYRQAFATFTKIMPGMSIDMLLPATMTTFFQRMNERERLVGKGEKRRGVKKSTIATYRSKLNSFFEWLKKRKLIV